VLDPRVLDWLPLSAAPVSDWASGDDLHQFLIQAYGPDYQGAADYTFDEGRKRAGAAAAELTRVAKAVKPSVAAEGNTDEVPDFHFDSSFGLAWRHLIVWEALINAMLSDSFFFSLAHALESESDLDASFYLISRFYYKHALQALRSFVETCVLPVWFAAIPTEFTKWRSGGTVPNMRSQRKREGMLDRLVDEHVLDIRTGALASELYGQLNGAIHARESRLIHRGVDRAGKYRGEVFKRDDFNDWSLLMSRAVAVGSRLLQVSSEQWLALLKSHDLICDICHNSEGFTVSDSTDDHDVLDYLCPSCGHTFGRLKKGSR